MAKGKLPWPSQSGPKLESPEVRAKLPEAAEREVLRHLVAGEDIEVAIASDITREGRYGFSGLAATERGLFILDGEPDGELTVEALPFEEIISVRHKTYVGNGELEIITYDRGPRHVRHSRTLDGEFEKAAQKLSRLLRQRRIDGAIERAETQEQDEEEAPKEVPEEVERLSLPQASMVKADRCEKCGSVLVGRGRTCPRCAARGKTFLRLLTYVRPHKDLAVSVLILSLAMSFLGILPVLLTKPLVDDVFKRKDFGYLLVLVMVLAFVYLFNALLSGCRQYLSGWLGQEIIYDLRNDGYRNLQRLSLSFFDRRRTGELMSRVNNDTQRVQGFLVQVTQQTLIDVMTMLWIGVILFLLDWRLALMTMVPIPLISYGTIWFTHKIHGIYHRLWRRVAALNALLTDTISGIRLVKAFGQEDGAERRFSRKSDEYFVENVRSIRLRSVFFPAIHLSTLLGSLAIWIYGGWKHMTDPTALTLGSLLVFMRLIWQFYNPVRNLSLLSHQFQHAATSAERVFEVIDTEREIDEVPGAVTLETMQGEVEADGVAFGYEPGQTVLHDINFVAKPGQMIGIVGPSGVGKTTLANLLLRFYDVTQGRISIDGVNVRELSLTTLREFTSVVLQDPFLFHGTILENIRYSQPEAPLENVIRAAKAASAHDFICEFPDAYDTHVGERGVRLSGGQKQRIAIARAILKDPRILILDEATSSVDTETESLIQAAMEQLVKDRTTFVIAHRLSTLRRADCILVLNDGTIVERGTHEELLAMGGFYASLCDKQALMAKIDAFQEEV